ncbi:MAG: hypothetical protein K8H89_04755 [Flavobacteriales bacterium]|jgi:hypothetical protein|nr:hypothetical protein [Flavobacteriales bacterium]MCB0756919.1 hypothetical protein [Flavobacteriales bacterium]
MKRAALGLLSLVVLLQGCSRQEYIVVTNRTGADLAIEYEIELPMNGFPIFNEVPRVYDLAANDAFRWDKTRPIVDLDTMRSRVVFILPPGKGLMIGGLSNDTYTSHDQYFINGRHFNLKRLSVRRGRTTTVIKPELFDQYFTKQGNLVIYRIS